MPCYLTEYPMGEHKYACSLFAKSKRHAASVAKKRGMGEAIIGKESKSAAHVPASRMLRSARYTDADKLHAVTFLCMLAHSSGVASWRETIGDEGVLHEFIHHMAGAVYDTRKRRKRMISRVEELEKRVPGYLET